MDWHVRVASGAALVLACAGASLGQEGTIDHRAVDCLVAGRFPVLQACFEPRAQVARARVYFRTAEADPSWYFVEMKPAEGCLTGVLPRPKRALVGKQIAYYVEVVDKAFAQTRTTEYAPAVVATTRDCKPGLLAAPWVGQASVVVGSASSLSAGLPAGFAAGGLSTTAVVAGVVGAGAAVGGAAAATGGDDGSGSSTPATTATAAPTTVPATTLPSTTPPVTAPPARDNQPPVLVLNVAPDPPRGRPPLRVAFNACRSSDPDRDELRFSFDFGDGARDQGRCLAEHTYDARGDALFTATVCVSDRRPDHERCESVRVTLVQRLAAEAATTRLVEVISDLQVPAAQAQLLVGAGVSFQATGRVQHERSLAPGLVRLEARLIAGASAGTWRFELPASLTPDSLHVSAGAVERLAGRVIVFRLTGQPGERLAFEFTTD